MKTLERTQVGDVFRIAEATVSTDGSRMLEITIIRKGFGNPVGGRYYPSSLMRESAKMFVGRKMYADHDTPQAQRARGGQPRSVKELVGSIKEAWYDPASDSIKGKVKILQNWLWEIVSNDPTAVGVSIDAYGKGNTGMAEGRQAKIVESFTQVNSVDFVTEAGAGGTIDNVLESKMEEIAMGALDNLTLDMLREHRPDLMQAIQENGNSGGGANSGVTVEAMQEAISKAVTEAVDKVNASHARDIRVMESRTRVADILSRSGLAAPSQAAIAKDFHDVIFEDITEGDKTITATEQLDRALESAIKTKREEIAAYTGGVNVRGMGAGSSSTGGGDNSGGGSPVSIMEAAPAHVQFMQEMGITVEDASAGDKNKDGE